MAGAIMNKVWDLFGMDRSYNEQSLGSIWNGYRKK